MKTSHVATALALGLFFRVTSAHADLVPPGGEGVSECRNKKAGAACENYFIDVDKIKTEPGTCVEEKLDHLHFKFKAHLRCVSANVPKPQASVATHPPSAAAAPPEMPSAAPVTPSAAPVPPAPISSVSAAPEAPKSGGCSLSLSADPSSTVAFCFSLLGLGVLLRGKRRPVPAHVPNDANKT